MAVDYKKEGRVAIFTINRPEAMNSLSLQALQEMRDAMEDFRDDPDLYVGIITGAGERSFCGGADIKDVLPFLRENRDRPWALPGMIMRGLDIWNVWKPLVAAINGLAGDMSCGLS